MRKRGKDLAVGLEDGRGASRAGVPHLPAGAGAPPLCPLEVRAVQCGVAIGQGPAPGASGAWGLWAAWVVEMSCCPCHSQRHPPPTSASPSAAARMSFTLPASRRSSLSASRCSPAPSAAAAMPSVPSPLTAPWRWMRRCSSRPSSRRKRAARRRAVGHVIFFFTFFATPALQCPRCHVPTAQL